MAVFKRGKFWWFEFRFRGVRIRVSSNSGNKEVAGRIERERRRQLELGTAGLQESKRPSLFSLAALASGLKSASRTGAPAMPGSRATTLNTCCPDLASCCSRTSA
jgi:hypothetical protein